MSWFSDKILDDVLGFDKPKSPSPIVTPQADTQEVISASDRLRKRSRTPTNLTGGGAGAPTLSSAALYGL